jgi:hypothetical protein
MTISFTVTEISPPCSQEPYADPRQFTVSFAVGFFPPHEMKIPQPPIISVRASAFLAKGYERKYIVRSASRIQNSRAFIFTICSPFTEKY